MHKCACACSQACCVCSWSFTVNELVKPQAGDQSPTSLDISQRLPRTVTSIRAGAQEMLLNELMTDVDIHTCVFSFLVLLPSSAVALTHPRSQSPAHQSAVTPLSPYSPLGVCLLPLSHRKGGGDGTAFTWFSEPTLRPNI